ncbi:MAG: hypothetical protein HC913_04045 [Microscillaceae bacterium]|nr:hypothetical protein [Microscillaceae bacterium]
MAVIVPTHFSSQKNRPKPQHSCLVVDEQCRIFLPEYASQTEVEMQPLVKVLYLFFLKHPEGVLLYDLYDYRQEFLQIYQQITRMACPKVIAQNVDRLLNRQDNSIHEKFSRIKSTLAARVPGRLLKELHCLGAPWWQKNIAIAPHLVDWKV